MLKMTPRDLGHVVQMLRFVSLTEPGHPAAGEYTTLRNRLENELPNAVVRESVRFRMTLRELALLTEGVRLIIRPVQKLPGEEATPPPNHPAIPTNVAALTSMYRLMDMLDYEWERVLKAIMIDVVPAGSPTPIKPPRRPRSSEIQSEPSPEAPAKLEVPTGTEGPKAPSLSIDMLRLSIMTRHALGKIGITTIAELCRHSPHDLREKGLQIGNRGMRDMMTELEKRNLQLVEDQSRMTA